MFSPVSKEGRKDREIQVERENRTKVPQSRRSSSDNITITREIPNNQ